MRPVNPSRRGVLKLGAAVVMLCLAGAGHEAVSAQTSAPAQIPGQPSSPGGAQPMSATVEGTWLWQRSEYSDDSTVTVSDPSRYVLGLLPGGRLTLQADCNQGSGTYSVSGSRITFQPGAMTLAACGPDSQDTVFMRDLRRVVTWVRDGENLVLNMQVDSGIMVFSPQPVASLTGAPWRVQGVNNGRGGVQSVVQGTELSVTFGEDGTASGETGCNTFRGPYTVSGSTIAFGAFATT